MSNEKDVKDTGVVSQEKINEAIKDSTQSEYYQQNRIPLITGEYRKEAFLKLKGLFLKELYKAAEEEEKACRKADLEPQMKGEKMKYIEDMVESFTNMFQLESLAQYLYQENIIPTLEEVNTRANKLNENLGKLEL